MLNEKDFKEQLRKILQGYGKTYEELGDALIEKVFAKVNAGMKLSKAVAEALEETDFFALNRAAVADAVYLSACAGYGVLPQMVAKAAEGNVRNRLLSESWNPDKMNLSKRLHKAHSVIRQQVIDQIQASMRNMESVKQMAMRLYDGYNSGKAAIGQAELPKYLAQIKARAALAGASEEAMKKLRVDAQALLKSADKLKTPALKAAYKAFLETCTSKDLRQSALEKAAWVAVQEKSRYYAERIARTEAARAWFDGFIAENAEDEEVWGYRWMLSSRHSLVPFDQCDVCANMDVGYGKGMYPKNKVPGIPRHPHCMCLLEVVYVWEIDETARFIPSRAKQYINSLTEAERRQIFGKDGAEKYKRGGDWQKLLRGWNGFGEPQSRLKGLFGASATDDLGSEPGEVRFIKKINPKDALKELKKAEAEIVSQDHEIAVVVTKQGKMYRVEGGRTFVNIHGLPDEELYGAFMTHNHPADVTRKSFSPFDISEAMQNRFSCLRGVDEEYEYELRFKKNTVFKEASEIYHDFTDTAYKKLLEKTVRESRSIDLDEEEYHEINIMLAKEYGYSYRRKRRG